MAMKKKTCSRIPQAQVMTPKHPRWEEFFDRLIGRDEGIGFRYDPETNQVYGRCPGGHTTPNAEKILRKMGMDVPRSLAYFQRHHGWCDCEICMNCYLRPTLKDLPPCEVCGAPNTVMHHA